MSKIIKEPVYREVLECENCGERWLKDRRGYYSAEICECWVCKKEGCGKCSTWTGSTGERYYYHFKCEKKLPKNVLRAKQDTEDKYDRQQEWSEYVNRRY